MDFNPDNLIFFYLTIAILLLATSIMVYTTVKYPPTKDRSHRSDKQ